MTLKPFFLISLFFSLVFCCALYARNNEPHKNVEIVKNNVWIKKIPQVNQKRNYCVPACISMVVRYFDTRITQKQLGKLFDTDSKKGTVTEDFVEAFKNTSELQEFSLEKIYALSEKEYANMMQLYDSASKNKRKKSGKIKENSNIFDNVNRELARKVFPHARPQLEVVMNNLCYKYINSGIPVLWCVAMNLDPHVKMKGGHMRLIVGYNKQNGKIKKILYRDPWGGSTRYKQVDFEDAQTMTMQLYVLTPRSGSTILPPTGVISNTRKIYKPKRK